MKPSASSSQTSKTSLSLLKNCRSCSCSGKARPSIIQASCCTHTQLIFWFSSIKRTVRHRLRRSPSPSQPSAPPDRLVPLLLYKQHGTLKRREECRKYATTYEFVTRHYVTGQLLIHNPGVLSLSSRF